MNDIKAGESNPESALLDDSLSADNSLMSFCGAWRKLRKTNHIEHEAMYCWTRNFLHLQTAVDGFDYTFYDKSIRQLDGACGFYCIFL